MFAWTSTAGSSNSDRTIPPTWSSTEPPTVSGAGDGCPGRRRSGDGAGSAPSSSLPWSVTRQGVEPDERGRHHVVGQPCGEDVAQFRRGG